MKKFRFKLEALKKLKDFNEHKVKIEIGKVNKEIAETNSKLAQCEKDLQVGYDSQEKVAKEGATGKFLQFYPYFTEGKMAQVKKYENIKYSLEKKYFELVETLRVARGEAELMEKMKDKDETKFKREETKKIEIEIQDNFLITRESRSKN